MHGVVLIVAATNSHSHCCPSTTAAPFQCRLASARNSTSNLEHLLFILRSATFHPDLAPFVHKSRPIVADSPAMRGIMVEVAAILAALDS